jgi:hypothetical protein
MVDRWCWCLIRQSERQKESRACVLAILSHVKGHTFSEEVPVRPQPALMTKGPAGTQGTRGLLLAAAAPSPSPLPFSPFAGSHGFTAQGPKDGT